MAYTLDDALIHLAVGEVLLQGGYGVNVAEVSAPSSSIFYPFLMAGGLLLRLGTWTPLLINLICMGGAVWIAADLLHRRVLGDVAWPLHATFGLLVLLSMNAWALPLMGMEHSLHVLLSLLALRLAMDLQTTRHAAPALAFLAVLLPLVRFEGVAMAGCILLLLLVAGRWRLALATLAGAVIALGAHVVWMGHLGLPPLPSSVMVKSSVGSSQGDGGRVFSMLRSIGYNYVLNVNHPKGMGMMAVLVACALAALHRLRAMPPREWLSRPEARVFLLLAGTTLAHLAGGSFRSFHRYEVYAFAPLVLGTLWMLAPLWRGTPFRRYIPVHVASALLLVLLVRPYAQVTALSPMAWTAIYQQQVQVHRLLSEHLDMRVAVNDLGWASYGNPNHVLDLWGLGSERVRQARVSGTMDAALIAELVAEYEVPLAIVYVSWFGPRIPEDWECVAKLVSSSVSVGSPFVTVFATTPEARQAIEAGVRDWAQTLPKGAALANCSLWERLFW